MHTVPSGQSELRRGLHLGIGLALPVRGDGLAGVGLALVVAPLVGNLLAHCADVAEGDAQDEHEPEDVDGLQRGEQAEDDDLREPALVLARLPVDLEGADGLELGQDGVEDAQVDVVAEVGPDEDEEAEVGPAVDGVEVVEGFGGLREWGDDCQLQFLARWEKFSPTGLSLLQENSPQGRNR